MSDDQDELKGQVRNSVGVTVETRTELCRRRTEQCRLRTEQCRRRTEQCGVESLFVNRTPD